MADAAAAVVPAGPGSIESQLYRTGESAHRSIPEAIFIENVEQMCATHKNADVVAKLQELYSKYQYMQSSLTAQRASLKSKLPDISAALETVNHLVEKKAKSDEGETSEYTYQLSENIYAKATAPPADTVCLWLGANCMLEYKLEEAVDMLRTNESNARTTCKSLEEDMAFLRDQITTTEVNIARAHNYGVKLRAKEKEDQAAALPSPGAAPAAAAPFAPPGRIADGVAAAPAGSSSKGAYTLKQEKDEVEVSLRMPKGAQKADVKVVILADSLRVEHLGQVLLEGGLAGKCSPNGSTWTMSGSRMEITLVKAEPGEQWPALFDVQA